MKKLKYLVFTMALFALANNKVLASGYISTSSGKVTVGSTFSATASVSGVASWSIRISASGPVSGCSGSFADTTPSGNNGSKSYTVSCKATGTGNITVSLSGNATDQNLNRQNLSGSRTVTVVEKSSSNNNGGGTSTNNVIKKEKTKSSSTKLEEFGVKGYKITPEFNNDTNSYSLTVPYDTTKITIYTSRSSDKQTVTGIGDKEVTIGENKFNVVVTAEDGTRKTISLNVNVDKKPIVVKVDGKEYSVVKNKDELPELKIEHSDMKLTLEEQEVDAYRLDKIGYILIGLKDSEGKVDFYKFVSFKNDEKPMEYHLLKFLSVKDFNLIYLDFPKSKIPSGYKKYEEVINDVKYVVYKLNSKSKYSLVYGVNPDTGKEGIYKYESSENTIQLYDKEEVKSKNELIKKYQKFGLILAGVIGLLILITTISLTRRGKSVEDVEELTKRDIRNIEKKTKAQEKKNQKEIKKKEKAEKKKLKKGEPDM